MELAHAKGRICIKQDIKVENPGTNPVSVNMRKDRDYVDKVTGITLDTTDFAHDELCAIISSEFEDMRGLSRAQSELLLALENDYYEVPNSADIKTMYNEVKKAYKANVGFSLELTLDEFKSLWCGGYIAVRKVIWDE